MGTEGQIIDLDRANLGDPDAGEPGGDVANEAAIAVAGSDLPDRIAFDLDAKRPADRSRRAIGPLLIAVALIWTGFFIHTLWAADQLPAGRIDGIRIVSDWALPVAMILLLWLVALRTSGAEAARFADAGAAFTGQVDTAEARLKAMTGEIALARSLIDAEARRLETLGREASGGLASAAGTMGQLFDKTREDAAQLDTLTESARRNLAALREELPVAGSATRDLTNQIGAAGRAAQAQIASLREAIEAAGRAGATLRETVGDIEARTAAAGQRMDARVTDMAGTVDALVARIDTDGQAVIDSRRAGLAEAGEALDSLAKRQQTLLAAQVASLSRGIADVDAALAAFGDGATRRVETLQALTGRLDERLAGQQAAIEQIDADSVERIEAARTAIGDLGATSATLGEKLAAIREDSATLAGEVARLFADVEDRRAQFAARIEPDFAKMFDRASEARGTLEALAGQMQALSAKEAELAELAGSIGVRLERDRDAVSGLIADSAATLAGHAADADALHHLVERVSSDGLALADAAGDRLESVLQRVREEADRTIDSSRTALDTALDATLDRFRSRLDGELAQQADRIAGALEGQFAARIDAAERRIAALAAEAERRIGALDIAADNLAARLDTAQDMLPRHDEAGFAREMALLVESLNSASIDVAKLLSTEVTDTAWAAYLKGDRGVFTRRAVRLLNTAEVRAVATAYEADGEFREQVNRYIHDFEAMIRGLLSTRDGSALSVTLLSSDVGKLYVALAQAIERLRG